MKEIYFETKTVNVYCICRLQTSQVILITIWKRYLLGCEHYNEACEILHTGISVDRFVSASYCSMTVSVVFSLTTNFYLVTV
jgi:hypothetical protein